MISTFSLANFGGHLQNKVQLRASRVVRSEQKMLYNNVVYIILNNVLFHKAKTKVLKDLSRSGRIN